MSSKLPIGVATMYSVDTIPSYDLGFPTIRRFLPELAMTDLIIDHVLIAVRDLDAAKDTFERLGFKVTPEGRHPGRGTSNRLVASSGESTLS